MTQDEQLQWQSHLPALMACIGSTVGPVLELGVGHFSTPILHALLMAQGRELTSVEDNPVWYEKFLERYGIHGRRHEFVKGPYDEAVSMLSRRNPWSVSFIDNSPGGERRARDFATLLPVSQFVVVHDFHHENEEAIKPLLEGVHWSVTSDYQPPTLIASMVRLPPPV